MKYKLFSMFLVIIFLVSLVSAVEIGYTTEDARTAGLLPDSPFYQLKLTIQKITEVFGDKIRLKHAEQRLSEIKVMTALGMEEDAKKSIHDFDRIYNSMKNKEKLMEQRRVKDNLGQKISAITSVSKGNMTAEEKEQIRTEIKQLITTHKEIQKIKSKNYTDENKPIIYVPPRINKSTNYTVQAQTKTKYRMQTQESKPIMDLPNVINKFMGSRR